MLSDNKTALGYALSLTADELRNKVSAAYLYGSADTLTSVLNRRYDTVIGALFNADTDGVFEQLTKRNPHGLIAGLIAAKKVCGASEALLVLPREEGFAALRDAAAKADIAVAVRDFLDVRAHKNDLLLHWATLAALSDLIVGKPQNTLAAIGGELRDIAFGETLDSFLPTENVKALRIGAEFFTPEVLREPVRPDFFRAGGAIAIIGGDACIVQTASEQISALRRKCCGKCTLCREGLFQFAEIMCAISAGKSAPSELALADEIGGALKDAALCSVGKQAALSVLTALTNFKDELETHIRGKRCPAGRCMAFTTFYVNPVKCTGCGGCIDACPEDCIEGRPGYISMIDDLSCTKCGKCAEVCPEGAVVQTQNRKPKLPERLTKVGRLRR